MDAKPDSGSGRRPEIPLTEAHERGYSSTRLNSATQVSSWMDQSLLPLLKHADTAPIEHTIMRSAPSALPSISLLRKSRPLSRSSFNQRSDSPLARRNVTVGLHRSNASNQGIRYDVQHTVLDNTGQKF